VTVEEYQYYWQRANERISSSFSGLHFGHYKAASFHPRLSALHAAKLSACAKTGVPHARWGTGVNVLLEKIMGNNFVHKLRAICLLEADFNWWNKLVAKRMMTSAGTRGFVPGESFAKTGSSCEKAVLTKIFIVDDSRIRHYPMCLGENDFGDCYDRVSHLPAAMALRGWGIPKEAVKILLQTMQLMQYFLRTGYGESKQSYGGRRHTRRSLHGIWSREWCGSSWFFSCVILDSQCLQTTRTWCTNYYLPGQTPCPPMCCDVCR